MFQHLASRARTETSFKDRVIPIYDVLNENNLTFERGVNSGADVLVYLLVGFQQEKDQGSQLQMKRVFMHLQLSAQKDIGSDVDLDVGRDCDCAFQKKYKDF